MSNLEFNEVLNQNRNPLMFFALKLTTDEEEAKDLLQDTMLKALSYRDKLLTKSSVKGWLYTIMKNTFINQYRRDKKLTDIKSQMVHQGYVSTRSSDVSMTPDKKMSVKDMEQAIEDLDDAYRIPFQMKLQGYRYHEIGEHMGIPIGTVKSRIFLARKQLTATLADYAPHA